MNSSIRLKKKHPTHPFFASTKMEVLELMKDLHQRSLKANLVTYTAAMAACGRGLHWYPGGRISPTFGRISSEGGQRVKNVGG